MKSEKKYTQKILQKYFEVNREIAFHFWQKYFFDSEISDEYKNADEYFEENCKCVNGRTNDLWIISETYSFTIENMVTCLELSADVNKILYWAENILEVSLKNFIRYGEIPKTIKKKKIFVDGIPQKQKDNFLKNLKK